MCLKRKSPFDEVGDGSEDDATFYSLGAEFLEAAWVLMNVSPTRLGYAAPTYYLIGHAAELFLKAYLSTKGVPVKELKGAGHDLSKLLTSAKQRDFPLVDDLPQLTMLSLMYNQKRFEYRGRRKLELPSLEALFVEAKNLERNVVNWFPSNG